MNSVQVLLYFCAFVCSRCSPPWPSTTSWSQIKTQYIGPVGQPAQWVAPHTSIWTSIWSRSATQFCWALAGYPVSGLFSRLIPQVLLNHCIVSHCFLRVLGGSCNAEHLPDVVHTRLCAGALPCAFVVDRSLGCRYQPVHQFGVPVPHHVCMSSIHDMVELASQ